MTHKERTVMVVPTDAELRDQAAAKAARGAQASVETKAIANHKWYEANAGKKKRYNKEYYQSHKEYWQERYKTSHDAAAKAKARFEKAKSKFEAASASNEQLYRSNPSADEIARAHDKAAHFRDHANALYEDYLRYAADVQVAKLNVDRSKKEYDEYVASTAKKTSLKDLWKSGAKSIVDSGKKFLSKIFK